MALHLVPDDGSPHAPSTECGCGVSTVRIYRPDGTIRRAFAHGTATPGNPGGWPEADIYPSPDRLNPSGGVFPA